MNPAPDWKEQYAKQCARRAAKRAASTAARMAARQKKEALERSEDIAAELVADDDARTARHLMTPPDYRNR